MTIKIKKNFKKRKNFLNILGKLLTLQRKKVLPLLEMAHQHFRGLLLTAIIACKYHNAKNPIYRREQWIHSNPVQRDTLFLQMIQNTATTGYSED